MYYVCSLSYMYIHAFIYVLYLLSLLKATAFIMYFSMKINAVTIQMQSLLDTRGQCLYS